MQQGQLARSLGQGQAALALFRDLGARSFEALTLNNIGQVYNERGEWEQALSAFRQSLDIKEALGDEPGKAYTFHNLGLHHMRRGEWDEALGFFGQALAIRRKLGDKVGLRCVGRPLPQAQPVERGHESPRGGCAGLARTCSGPERR